MKRVILALAVLAVSSAAHAGCTTWATPCVAKPAAKSVSTYSYLPDPVKTPGVVGSTDTALVCEKDYPARVRHVTNTTKKKVYKRYNVKKELCTQGCKIDHLIPLSIGGSNDIENLWPHEYGAERNVFQKTRLEVRLRKEVCTGKLPITEAQTCIKNNWAQCFDRFYP